MKITFVLAKHFNVTPFEIMAQDLEEVIMVVNYLVESGKQSNNDNNKYINEREADKEFWTAL